MAIVLAVLFTIKTGASNTTAATSANLLPIISASWRFDNLTHDQYDVYNSTLINGTSYSSISSYILYVGTGRALNLSSSFSHSVIVSTQFFNLTYRSFTIEAWVASITTYTGDYSIFGQCQCSTCMNQCLLFIVRDGRLYADFILNDVVESTALTGNVWYHVAFVYNADTQQQILYLNGIQDAINSNVPPYQGMNGSIQIGSTSASRSPNYFVGYIDNLQLTTRAKSAIVAGRVNQAMRFIGVSSYFQAYGFYQAGFGVIANQRFSISIWINPSSTYSSALLQQSTTQTDGTCLNMIGFYAPTGRAGQLTVQAFGYPTMFGPYITLTAWTYF